VLALSNHSIIYPDVRRANSPLFVRSKLAMSPVDEESALKTCSIEFEMDGPALDNTSYASVDKNQKLTPTTLTGSAEVDKLPFERVRTAS